jgi:hypothetical protein
MEDNAEAPLSPATREEIAIEQYTVHQKFWDELRPLVSNRNSAMAAMIVGGAKGPPMPKQPIRLFTILGRYAAALFNCEEAHYRYEQEQEVFAWRSTLSKKIEQTVIDNADSIGQPFLGLSLHAKPDEMRAKVREALKIHIDTLRKPILPIRFPPLSESEPLTPGPPIVAPSQPAITSIRERLDDLAIVIGHDEQAQRIGISRSSYYKVKAGGGGKTVRKKTEKYLSKP